MNEDDPYKPPLPTAEDVLDPISADLRSLLTRANGGPLSLHDIEQHLKDRGYALLVLFLAAPFPIPNIPGLSVPFGIAMSPTDATTADVLLECAQAAMVRAKRHQSGFAFFEPRDEPLR